MMRGRLILWIPSVVLALACGDDASGPDRVTYHVVATQLESEVFSNGAVTATYSLRVIDLSSTPIPGALLLVGASHGQVSPSSGVSDDAGLLTVGWAVTPAQRGVATTLVLRACAEETDPPICTPTTVATIQL